jgi:hypothetical protein
MSHSISPVTVGSCHHPSRDCVKIALNLQNQDDGIPQSFICPLTLNVMMDPVMDFDGNTYERSAIVEWLANNGTSPVTRNPLRKDHLVPNRALREVIFAHMGPEWSRNAEKELRPIPKEHQPAPIPSTTPTAANNEYRAAIDSFLEQISRAVGKNIRLNDQGICAFTYEQITVAVEVPETVGSFFIYSQMEFDLGKRMEMLQKAMELNYLQQETRGGCLSCEKTNGNLFFSYTDRVEEVDSTDFRNILENFIDTAIAMSAIFKAL